MDEKPSYVRGGQDKTERFAVYLQSSSSIRTGIILEGVRKESLSDAGK